MIAFDNPKDMGMFLGAALQLNFECRFHLHHIVIQHVKCIFLVLLIILEDKNVNVCILNFLIMNL